MDVFVANCNYIARRIRKVYRREAEVIHPPVDIERFTLRTDKQDFYLAHLIQRHSRDSVAGVA